MLMVWGEKSRAEDEVHFQLATGVRIERCRKGERRGGATVTGAWRARVIHSVKPVPYSNIKNQSEQRIG